IEFESPGGLVGREGLEAAKQGRTTWRNPSLARYLVELRLAQERGTGLPKAIELTKFVAGVEPIFDVDRSLFKVTCPLISRTRRRSRMVRPLARKRESSRYRLATERSTQVSFVD